MARPRRTDGLNKPVAPKAVAPKSVETGRVAVVGLVASATLLAGCSGYSGPFVAEADLPHAPDNPLASASAQSPLGPIDSTKWQYNAETNVFWQTGIQYAATPPAPEYASLGIYVPGEYMNAVVNEDGVTYTAGLNIAGKVGDYTAENAPWVMPVSAPGYAEIPAPTGYQNDATAYTSQGFIYMVAGARGRSAGAPTGVADLKAAIRYVRVNCDALPGDEDKLYAFGTGGGAGEAAVLGASGNSRLYSPYLKQMGAAEGASDAVAGVMAWSPITNLDYANAEYEWQFGAAREGLDSQAQALSMQLASSYATHVNSLGLLDRAGKKLTLDRSDQGVYQTGPYYQFMKGLVEQSLTTFLTSEPFPYTVPAQPSPPGAALGLNLAGKTFASQEEYIAALNADGHWVRFDTNANRATITSMADFVKRMKPPTKTVGAFDGLDAQQNENQLFGFGDGKGVHFDPTMAALLDGTPYQKAFTMDLEKKDSVGSNMGIRVDMYNPLYYLNSTYLGFQSSDVAPQWRIRSDIHQGETSLTTETNLALALQNTKGVSEVDYATVWGKGQIMAEVSGDPTGNFIKWVHTQAASGE